VAALAPGELAALHEQVMSLSLTALVEVHDEREMEVALEVGAQVIGINNRDLTTLEVDLRRGLDLVRAAPEGVIKVAESGFSAQGELRELEAGGFDAVLMGEALMRSEDIVATCSALTAPTM